MKNDNDKEIVAVITAYGNALCMTCCKAFSTENGKKICPHCGGSDVEISQPVNNTGTVS